MRDQESPLTGGSSLFVPELLHPEALRRNTNISIIKEQTKDLRICFLRLCFYQVKYNRFAEKENELWLNYEKNFKGFRGNLDKIRGNGIYCI